ncbi:MAG TPA: TRAP transporter small permease subunit [Dehalococcoidales bacterium]|nr:TRAP transporter small permease subunit [Dehalococcoidales bacterium]
MRRRIDPFFKGLDTFCERAGTVVSLLSLALMVLIVVSVFMRYVLNVSFIWGYPLSRQIFALFILFAALYALVTDSHLRVEILYARLSGRIKFLADIIDLSAFLLFIGVWVWQSGLLAQNSVANLELSQGTPKVPLYYIKSIIPVMAFLLFLQGISFFYRHRAKKRGDEVPGLAEPGADTMEKPAS